jgi:hypothetical protein
MVSIEVIDENSPPVLLLEGPKEKVKRVRRTAEQIAANARAKLDRDLQARIQKAAEAERKKQAKRNAAKSKRAANRNASRQTVRNRVLSAARATGLPFANEDIKVPLKGAKAEKVGDYLRAAKARYYKRTKLPDSITRMALERAAAEGLNAKHIKRTVRAKDVNAILAAARKKVSKNTGKTQRIQRRNEIIGHVKAHFGIADDKEVQKIVCYRGAAERKK